jgi:hypothetical protein
MQVNLCWKPKIKKKKKKIDMQYLLIFFVLSVESTPQKKAFTRKKENFLKDEVSHI